MTGYKPNIKWNQFGGNKYRKTSQRPQIAEAKPEYSNITKRKVDFKKDYSKQELEIDALMQKLARLRRAEKESTQMNEAKAYHKEWEETKQQVMRLSISLGEEKREALMDKLNAEINEKAEADRDFKIAYLDKLQEGFKKPNKLKEKELKLKEMQMREEGKIGQNYFTNLKEASTTEALIEGKADYRFKKGDEKLLRKYKERVEELRNRGLSEKDATFKAEQEYNADLRKKYLKEDELKLSNKLKGLAKIKYKELEWKPLASKSVKKDGLGFF